MGEKGQKQGLRQRKQTAAQNRLDGESDTPETDMGVPTPMHRTNKNAATPLN